MKTITMAIDALGVVAVDDQKMGRVGEHKNTRLSVKLDAAFAQGIDYFRMSFGGFETPELNPENGILTYDVPCAATGSTVKSWQLTGYKVGEQEPELVRKSQMCIFTLEPSVTGENDLIEQYSESIENDIVRAKAALAEADKLYDDFAAQMEDLRSAYEAKVEELQKTFVLRETGKRLSTNDFSDDDEQVLEDCKNHLIAMEPTRTFFAKDAGFSATASYPTADGKATMVGGIGTVGDTSGYLLFTVEALIGGSRSLELSYITMETRSFQIEVLGTATPRTYTVSCPGNGTDWDRTIQTVNIGIIVRRGINTIRISNPTAPAPNLVSIKLHPSRVRYVGSTLDFGKSVTRAEDLDAIISDGVYPLGSELTASLIGDAFPCLLFVVSEVTLGDNSTLPVQYLIGGTTNLHRVLRDGAWSDWTTGNALPA